MIQRVESDPRLEGATAKAAITMMTFSFSVMVLVGVLGAFVAQVIFGEGGVQFVVGMAAGYAAYSAYLALTMKKPRVVGVTAALTDKKLILLGSRRAGVVGEWKFRELDDVELVRKGNFFIMGKLAIRPSNGDALIFFTPNRRMVQDFVAVYQQISGSR